jgi:hypothetical protein
VDPARDEAGLLLAVRSLRCLLALPLLRPRPRLPREKEEENVNEREEMDGIVYGADDELPAPAPELRCATCATCEHEKREHTGEYTACEHRDTDGTFCGWGDGCQRFKPAPEPSVDALDSPDFVPPETKALAARNFERTNRYASEPGGRMGDEEFERRTAVRDELSGQDWMRVNSIISEARRARASEDALREALTKAWHADNGDFGAALSGEIAALLRVCVSCGHDLHGERCETKHCDCRDKRRS